MTARAKPRRDTSSMSELFASDGSGPAFAAELGALISAVRRELVRHTAADWASGNVSTAQAELLLAVEREPGITVRDVAEYLNLAPNTISTLVRQLTERGLLVREPHPDDGRAVQLTISPDAQREFIEYRSARAHVLEEALKRLTHRERAALIEALPALSALLDELGRGEAAR
jgi:DNA-binding MarR family transcriptional regulator